MQVNVALSGNSEVSSRVKLEFWIEEMLEVGNRNKGL